MGTSRQRTPRGGAGAEPDSVSGLARPALPPFYYLHNFELVLREMHARYADLLSIDELRFVTDFPRLARSSRALLARMVMRRGTHFRLRSLEYAEIGDARAAMVPLIEAGWVCDEPLLHIAELERLLTKDQLLASLKLPRHFGRFSKAGLGAVLKAQFAGARRFAEWCPGERDRVCALIAAPICERFRLLYFGNDRQGWSEFVTADLKIFRYERVERSVASRPFQSRAQIELFQKLGECHDLFRAGMPPQDLLPLVPEAIENCDWLEDERQRLLFLAARELERAGERVAARSIYLRCRHRGSRLRAIRLTSRLHDWAETRALCLAAVKSPESEAELQYVRRVLPRVSRRLGIACEARHAPPRVPEFVLVLEGAPRSGSVEHRVRDHLAREIADADTIRYVENGLINSLFGLLCWPAVFAPIAGAFFHDFHSGPVDLASGHFHRRRRHQFEECLSQLESGGYRRSIWRTFRHKFGIQSPFVRWYGLDRKLLGWALDCLPAAHLRLWFEWILRDVKDNRAGFPDLIQFWPEERRYRMIEVKGPGDRLQDNQRRLLEFCAAHGMPVAVCYVRTAGAGGAPRVP